MSSDSMFALIRRCAPEDAAQSLLETPEGRTFSYADMDAVTARYARHMTGLGLAKGDRVAVQAEKSPEALFLYLACLRAGLVFLPLNTAYTGSEVDYLLGDAEPALFVCPPEREAEAEGLAAKNRVEHVQTLDGAGQGSFATGAAAAEADFDPVDCAAGDLAALLYTSGTTGRPKGAMLSHGNLASNGLVLRDTWGFNGEDVLLHALPIFHAHGLFVACHCVLLAGARMIWVSRFDRQAVLEQLPRASVFMGVPTFYTRLLAGDDFAAETCRAVRLFVSGSAPLLAETHQEFQRRTGHAILERYGMTETGMNTSNPLEGERRAGTVGFPLRGTEVRVTDEAGDVLGPGSVGGLEVRGPNVFSGYWRLPEKTAEEFTADGWFRTGDLAEIDGLGYVHLVGRAKDLIISGGFNVYPKEIETVIDAVEGVAESAVIGLPHPDFGEAVAAVVAGDAKNSPSEEAVVAAAKAQLAGYKVPKRVFIVEALPRNAMGKVQKNVLRERYGDIFSY
jgi:malonyl-CoA/methylmalonyl-CoA synthetase